VVEIERPHRAAATAGQVGPDRRPPGRVARAAPGSRPAAHARADRDREARYAFCSALAENSPITCASSPTYLAPQLLAKRGVGPVSAAQAILSWFHRGRRRDDAAYAALAGASSIPPAAAASSVTGSTAAAIATSTAPAQHPADSTSC
jgi:hypothetical protein